MSEEERDGARAREAVLRERLTKLTAQKQTAAERHAVQLAAVRERLERRAEKLVEQREQLRAEVLKARAERSREAAARRMLQARPARGRFAELIAHDVDLARAAVTYTEELLAAGDRLFARSFAHGLLDGADTAAIGRICTGIHALADGFDDLAWELFEQSDRAELLRLAPRRLFTLWLRRDPEEGGEAVTRAMDDRLDLSTSDWWAVARELAGNRQYRLVTRTLEHIEQIDPGLAGLTAAEARSLLWTQERLPQLLRPTAAEPLAPGEVALGVLDYKMLDRDRTSSNLGDYVQSLAFLSNVARFSEVDFGSTPLGRKLESMKAAIARERRLAGVNARVRPVVVDRDFARGRSYPDPTWTVTFGWYMHPNFRTHLDFPFPDAIRPIFVSFHVNTPGMLSPEVVEYLRRYGPVGCRDWTTVYLLREKRVPAFFSGCVTTTVGQLFERPPPETASDAVAVVDLDLDEDEFPAKRQVKFTQVGDAVRELGIVEGLDAAQALLESYRGFAQVVTSRLHCYLPCRSMGLDVIFRPRNRADVRFEGLLDIDGPAFEAVRRGVERKLSSILEFILSGADEPDVYRRWADLCAPDLEVAKRYCTSFPPLPSPSFDIAEATSRIRATATVLNPRDGAGAIQIAFALDSNLADQLPGVVESVVHHLSRPAVISILCRGVEPSALTELALDHPDVTFQVFRCDEVDYGDRLRLLSHVTVSTMDRLLLPDLLSDVAKVIYLDVDIVVLADLAELYDIPLEGSPLAGKSSNFSSWKFGYKMVHRAAATLPAEKAWELRRRLHDEGPLDFPAFNAGVLLLDLERMRTDGFARFAVPLIEGFALNDQDALNMYARADRAELDITWNAVPAQDSTAEARIVHFAGPMKPWGEAYIHRARDFRRFRELSRQRRARRLNRSGGAGEPADSEKT